MIENIFNRDFVEEEIVAGAVKLCARCYAVEFNSRSTSMLLTCTRVDVTAAFLIPSSLVKRPLENRYRVWSDENKTHLLTDYVNELVLILKIQELSPIVFSLSRPKRSLTFQASSTDMTGRRPKF